ncbi:MAG: hypothetical protein HOE12_07030 [Gammaproteobacteria bacterium]|jgi:hypothetical protein|nr:hypothetical protein [Gammaproteobacteria bacterium]
MEQTTESYMVIPEIHGVFVDSVLTDEADNLVFGSFWGHDTAIREFQGRLTLGASEGGLSTFNIMGDDRLNQHKKLFVRVGNVEALDQMTGRVHTDILGELVHCWIYRQEIIKPDLANHRVLMISQDDIPQNLWNAIKLICPVPLLDHWKDHITPAMLEADMIKPLKGINQSGTQIIIDEDVMTMIVKTGCLNGSLRISNDTDSV